MIIQKSTTLFVCGPGTWISFDPLDFFHWPPLGPPYIPLHEILKINIIYTFPKKKKKNLGTFANFFQTKNPTHFSFYRRPNYQPTMGKSRV